MRLFLLIVSVKRRNRAGEENPIDRGIVIHLDSFLVLCRAIYSEGRCLRLTDRLSQLRIEFIFNKDSYAVNESGD